MLIPVDGAELFCVTVGRGPLCLIPSAVGTAPYQRQVPSALADVLTLAFVDLRGAGQSTGDAADLTFDLVADDLDHVRTHLEADHAMVLGHSMLGMLAFEYARRRPAHVSHVVTVGTPPIGDMATVTERGQAFFQAHAEPARRARLQENLAGLGPNPSMAETMYAQTPMRFHDPAVDPAPLFEGAISRPELLMHLMGVLAPTWSIENDPDSLTMLLLLHGRSDYVVPHVLWEGIPTRLPNATFHLFDASGHQPFVEEPAAFTDVVTTWLQHQTAA